MRNDEPNFSSMANLLDGITDQTRPLLAVVDSDVFQRKKLAQPKLLTSDGMAFANDSYKSLLRQCRSIEPASGCQGQWKESQCEITNIQFCDWRVKNPLDPFYLEHSFRCKTFERPQ